MIMALCQYVSRAMISSHLDAMTLHRQTEAAATAIQRNFRQKKGYTIPTGDEATMMEDELHDNKDDFKDEEENKSTSGDDEEEEGFFNSNNMSLLFVGLFGLFMVGGKMVSKIARRFTDDPDDMAGEANLVLNNGGEAAPAPTP